MSRSEVFLQEMGVGAQWRLRNRPAQPGGELEYVDAATPDELIEADYAQPVHAAQVHEPAPVAASRTPSAQEWIDAHEVYAEPEPAAQAQPAHVTQYAQPAQPAPPVTSAPAAQMAAPAAPRAAPNSEDMAWFDEAPMPAARSAAPPAAPAKAAPAAPQRPTAAQAAQQASQPGAADAEESTAWFDEAPAVPFSAPAPALQAGQEIANMDWPALQAAVSTCTRCDLCHSRQAAVPGRGDPHAQWLVLGTAPTAGDEQEVRAITGEPGLLLDNMLKAISVAPGEDAYITTLVKCRPPADDTGADRLPTSDELAACRPYLERELELAATRMILTLGHTAGKGLLGAAARGKVLRFDGIPTIATYHPADLLRKPADKAKAWSDLCLAKAAHAGRA